VTAASRDLVCLMISKATFNQLFGPLQEKLDEMAARRTEELGKTFLADLKLRAVVGSGSFGHVQLVLHSGTNTPYALKCMLKGRLAALSQTEHVLSEKEVLRKCNHPFIISLAATLQDDASVYMLLEWVPGGELFSIMQATSFLVEPVAAFYLACVTAALEHMHDRRIVYRDLKPENLLLDCHGYLKICDFGFAKVIETKTFTLCGTPEYLAPEIILNKGHTTDADWWALGILAHEMLIGSPPFIDHEDPMNIYKRILAGKLPEPSIDQPPLSKGARHMIEKLCTKEPSQRLGCTRNGAEDVKTHHFFSRINWKRLEKRLLQPPCTPQLSGPMDASSFALLSEPPYKAAEFATSLTPEINTLFKDW
jgi:serine/threonine protein kinase